MLKVGFENKKVILQLAHILKLKNQNMINALVVYYTDPTVKPINAHKNEGIGSGNFYKMVKKVNQLVDDIEKLQKIRLGLI